MTEPLNVEQAAARLQAAGSVLILCHKNPRRRHRRLRQRLITTP